MDGHSVKRSTPGQIEKGLVLKRLVTVKIQEG